MKKRILFTLSIIPLLCACQKGPYAKEAYAEGLMKESPSLVIPADNEIKDDALSFLKKNQETGNYVYSPASAALTNMLYDQKLDRYSEYVQEALNVKNSRFQAEALGGLASTNPVSDETRNDYLSHGVAVFEGKKEELEASLKDHFGQDIELGQNPGDYYVCKVAVRDDFYLPLSLKKLPFNGQGSFDYAYKAFLGKALLTEDGVIGEITVRETQLRFYLPKEGKSLSDIDVSLFFSELSQGARIQLTCPKFNLQSKHYRLLDNGRYLSQDARFEFSEKGIKGEAVTINGPTATDPSFEMELTLDRPFLFASIYHNIPLFIGQVALL